MYTKSLETIPSLHFMVLSDNFENVPFQIYSIINRAYIRLIYLLRQQKRPANYPEFSSPVLILQVENTLGHLFSYNLR